MNTPEFPIGQYVVKASGDYTFRGDIVAVFQKKSGVWRYVVENPEGILHIFSGVQLSMAIK
jgi:hypothetical protein